MRGLHPARPPFIEHCGSKTYMQCGHCKWGLEMTNSAQRHRVVVIGGGFGGLAAIQKLKGADLDITVIDRRNHHLFQPLLYQVATTSHSAHRKSPGRSACWSSIGRK
jgi:NADPH-dependent 2,4-dienoyl-CoA reductase/sulfur reductase-like enzyme